MDRQRLLNELVTTYRKYGWEWRRVLLRDTTGLSLPPTVSVHSSPTEALWFARPAADGREAWELRVLSETPYALFELFEPDESEEDREDVRREMEARLRDQSAPSPEVLAEAEKER